ncbi:MAG: hypothetical protein AMXMBFR56_81670 [Polyangiaceae bacterium]
MTKRNIARRHLRPESMVRLPAPEAAPPEDALELECELHPDVFDAVDNGWIELDPDGSVTLTMASVGKAPPALEAELATTGGRIAALRALGLPLLPVPAALQAQAQGILEVLRLVAESNEAPAEWIERVEELVKVWLVGSRSGVEPWMLALEAVMSVSAPTERGGRMGPGDPADAARDVIAKLRATCNHVPRAFDAESELTKGGSVLLDHRVRRSGKAGGRGALTTPWAAARDFADCFGLTMPEKKADAERKNKSARRRRNTSR